MLRVLSKLFRSSWIMSFVQITQQEFVNTKTQHLTEYFKMLNNTRNKMLQANIVSNIDRALCVEILFRENT